MNESINWWFELFRFGSDLGSIEKWKKKCLWKMLLLSTRLSSIFSTHNLDRHSSILTRSKKARSQVNLKFETVIFTVIVDHHVPGRMRELSEEASTNSPNFARRPSSQLCCEKKERPAVIHDGNSSTEPSISAGLHTNSSSCNFSLCRVCSLCSENVVDLLLCPRPNGELS